MTRGKIAQLNNKNGEHVFPVTSAQVVYMEDGRTSVKDKFEEFGSQLDHNVRDITSVLNTKTNLQQVKDEITKAQLQGGNVDTSNLVFKNEFNTLNDIVNNNLYNINSYDSYHAISLLGDSNIETQSVSLENDYINCNMVTTQVTVHTFEFCTDYKVKDTEAVTINFKDINMPNGFIGVGTGFNWSLMTKIDLYEKKEGMITFKVEDLVSKGVDENSNILIYLGTHSATEIHGKISFEILKKSNERFYATSSKTSNIALNSLSSEKAKLSNFSNAAFASLNAGVYLVNANNCIERDDNKKDSVKNTFKFTNKSSWINVKKENAYKGSCYGGFYTKIMFDDLTSLDGKLKVEVRGNNNSKLPNTIIILYEMTDWGTTDSGAIHLDINQEYYLKDLLDKNPDYEWATKSYMYLCVLNYNPNGNYDTFDFDVRITFAANDTINRATEITEDLKRELINEISTENIKYISCWGDSLTAGGGWTDILSNLSGLPLYNMGVGGESVPTIIARQGADSLYVNNITIPSDGSVNLGKNFETYLTSGTQRPFRQGFANFNPCEINGIKGNLSYTGQWDSPDDDYIFTRLEAGNEIIINRPTAIIGNCDKNYNAPYLMVIFMGQNGGWTDLDDLVNKHKLMINHAKAKHVIVLGLSTGSKSDRSEYENRMKKEFGRYFISIRDYLSTYGVQDAGITPTDTDNQMIAEGKVPQSLLSDAVHYNDTGKTVIGNMLFKKCKELNIF